MVNSANRGGRLVYFSSIILEQGQVREGNLDLGSLIVN